jgi:hypothetical protein
MDKMLLPGGLLVVGVVLLAVATYLASSKKNCVEDSCKKTKNMYATISLVLGLVLIAVGGWLLYSQNKPQEDLKEAFMFF